MNLKLRRPLLGILGAVAAFGTVFGSYSTFKTISDASPLSVEAVEMLSETCSCPKLTVSGGKATYSTENFTITHEQGTNKQNAVASYSPWRIYVGHVLTIESKTPDVFIESIVFNSDSSKSDPEVSSVVGGTFTVEGTTATFDARDGGTNLFSISPTSQWRIKSFEIFFTHKTVVPVSSISIESDTDTVYTGQTLQLTAVVNDDATNKTVSWSIDKPNIASLSDNGLLTGILPGNVIVTATAQDGTELAATKEISVLPDSLVSFDLVSGVAATQLEGNPFDSNGLVFSATYAVKGTIEDIDHSLISFEPLVINADTTEVVATYEGMSVNVPLADVLPTTSYYFGLHEDFAEWETGYEAKTLVYDEITASFSKANKQDSSQPINDCPVSKGGSLTITANEGYSIKAIAFGFKQWLSKTQDTALSISTDGISYGSPVASLAFPSGGTTIRYISETGFKAAKVEHSNYDNQIGWEYVSISFEKDSIDDSADSFAELFLGEELCDNGKTAPDVESWNLLAELYADDVSSEGKSILKSAAADEYGTVVEQCVARYDYIVGKYGSDVYQDFMGRSPEPLNYGLSTSKQMSEEAPAWICALTLLAATLVLGGAFIAKRRKESR